MDESEIPDQGLKNKESTAPDESTPSLDSDSQKYARGIELFLEDQKRKERLIVEKSTASFDSDSQKYARGIELFLEHERKKEDTIFIDVHSPSLRETLDKLDEMEDEERISRGINTSFNKEIIPESYYNNPFIIGQLFGDGYFLTDTDKRLPPEYKYWFICRTEAFSDSWLIQAKVNLAARYNVGDILSTTSTREDYVYQLGKKHKRKRVEDLFMPICPDPDLYKIRKEWTYTDALGETRLRIPDSTTILRYLNHETFTRIYEMCGFCFPHTTDTVGLDLRRCSISEQQAFSDAVLVKFGLRSKIVVTTDTNCALMFFDKDAYGVFNVMNNYKILEYQIKAINTFTFQPIIETNKAAALIQLKLDKLKYVPKYSFTLNNSFLEELREGAYLLNPQKENSTRPKNLNENDSLLGS